MHLPPRCPCRIDGVFGELCNITVEQSCLNVGVDLVLDRLGGCHHVASLWLVCVCVCRIWGAQVRTGDAIRV